MSEFNPEIDYLINIKEQINKHVNRLFLIFVFVGPAIAIFSVLGVFKDISLANCIVTSIVIFLLYVLHLVCSKRMPESWITTYLGLIGTEVIILTMNEFHIGIYLTFFLVPLISLMYCNRNTYIHASFIGLIGLVFGTYRVAEYRASLMVDFSPWEWFWGYLLGYVIEFAVMFLVGLVVNYLTSKHLVKLQIEIEKLTHQEIEMKDLYSLEHQRYQVFASMSEIYISMHLVDIEQDMVTEFLTTPDITPFHTGSENANMQIFHAMSELSTDTYRNDICEFVNFATLRPRLHHKKMISQEFVGRINGWCRASFIVVERNEKGEVTKVLYTVQNINDEKNKEAGMQKPELFDALTELGTRKSYVNLIEIKEKEGLSDNFTLLIFDINELNEVNEYHGKDIGDELVQGCAELLSGCFGMYGTPFRIGGDEFVVVMEGSRDLVEELCSNFEHECLRWIGSVGNKLSVSLGYARSAEFSGCSAEFLLKKADERMYEEKRAYYTRIGKLI